MIRYIKGMKGLYLRALYGCAAVVFLAVSGVSCTEVDDTLGTEFVPQNQILKLAIDSSAVVRTYNVTTDSVESSGFTNNYIGSYVSPQTGSVTGTMLFQMGAPYFPDDYKFGTTPVLDSVFLVLYIPEAMGKKDVAQTFELYELTEQIYNDSVYYADFDPAPILSPSPLLTFDYVYDKYKDQFIYKIEDPFFISRLADTTGYWNSIEFHKRFKGLCIKPKDETLNAAMLKVGLGSSYMVVNYHNFNAEPDTSVVLYRFAPDSYSYSGGNQSINSVKYDFSGADPEFRIDDMSAPVSRSLVLGYGGVSTFAEFDEASIKAIKQKAVAQGYREVAVNKAKLQVSIAARDVESVNASFDRLGMYTDLKMLSPIADYDYEKEGNSLYTINYGGYINKSKYMYEMDVTRMVQKMFHEGNSEWGVTIAPAVGEFNSVKQMELMGYGSVSPLRLIIAYTMIK